MAPHVKTKDGGSIANAVTNVSSLPISLAALESIAELDTVALLVMVPPSLGAVTVMVISGAVPTVRESLVHVTTPPASLQVHPVPEALLNVTSAGRVSDTEIDVAVLGQFGRA